jgi:hypothetical protein
MSRIFIFILIYHLHKPIDLILHVANRICWLELGSVSAISRKVAQDSHMQFNWIDQSKRFVGILDGHWLHE